MVGTDNAFPRPDGLETWHDWQSLGGIVESAPMIVAWGLHRLDTFAIGTDSGLYHRWWDGSNWGGWEGLGGLCQSAPTVVTWEPGRLDIFVVGTDSGLYHRWWDGARWGGFEGLGGTLSSRRPSPGRRIGSRSSHSARTTPAGTAGGTARAGVAGNRSAAF
jgi:Repeat of unknown function (DUF346)